MDKYLILFKNIHNHVAIGDKIIIHNHLSPYQFLSVRDQIIYI